VAGNVTARKLLHPWNAKPPLMAVNVAGNVTARKLLHPKKVPSPMVVNVAGNAISRKLLRLAKVRSPMAVTVSGKAISRKLLSKVPPPMEVKRSRQSNLPQAAAFAGAIHLPVRLRKGWVLEMFI
jgi:hypothetical protein